jgi:hypothetical protein
MRALECGYEVLLTAMSADEIISTKSPARRDTVLSRFGRLLYKAQCLWPPQEIVRLLVLSKLGIRQRTCLFTTKMRIFPKNRNTVRVIRSN